LERVEGTIDALVLLAHGSRNLEWARPFHRFVERMRAAVPEFAVGLGFFEHCAPTLEDALDEAARKGCTRILLQPLLLAGGFHLDEDLPRRLAAWQAVHPETTVLREVPIMENEVILQALLSAWRSRIGRSNDPHQV